MNCHAKCPYLAYIGDNPNVESPMHIIFHMESATSILEVNIGCQETLEFDNEMLVDTFWKRKVL